MFYGGKSSMLNVYICEDNVEQRNRVEGYVNEIIEAENLDMECVCATEDPQVILDCVNKEEQEGIFFLDIDLQTEMNGIQLADEIRKIQPRCYIVFITSHSEMSYMTFSYKVEAMDFIIKDNVREVKNRLHQCLLNCEQLSKQSIEAKEKNFMVKLGDYVKAVPFQDILYFEVSSNYRKVILHGKNAKVEFNGKIKELENRLDNRFYRCHRSILVNRDNIEQIKPEEGMLILKGGVTCPMSVRLGKGLTV